MQKFLIHINTDSELIAYEAISLGLTLATFDHLVQFVLGEQSLTLLTDATTRIYGIIQSLELYDIAPALHQFADDIIIDEPVRQALKFGTANAQDYDICLNF